MDNPGVYKILCLLNNKAYIGKSNRNVDEREYEHFKELKANIHWCKELQEDFNKYGIDNFKFEVLEYCTKSRTKFLESSYIIIYKNNCYNNMIPDENGKFRHSISSKEKTRNKLKGVKKLSNDNYKGFKNSQCNIEKEKFDLAIKLLEDGLQLKDVKNETNLSISTISRLKCKTHWYNREE
jgi:group I intron endonuclease